MNRPTRNIMLSYKSDFSNQNHQLNVSISKHWFLLKNGNLKWQEKKLEVNWKNVYSKPKENIVHFVIRDHFSNCYYGESHSISNLPEIEAFLYRAWSKKEEYPFQGCPKTLFVPQTVFNIFPKIQNFKRNTSMNLEIPTSGFHGGIRVIREWESQFKYFSLFCKGTYNLQFVQENIININIQGNGRTRDKKESNIEKWASNLPGLILPGEKQNFFQFFE